MIGLNDPKSLEKSINGALFLFVVLGNKMSGKVLSASSGTLIVLPSSGSDK